jgi:hypothetical protein
MSYEYTSVFKSLYSYLKQPNMSFFSFTKLEGRRAEQVLSGGASGRREDVGKGCRRVNMVQILCVHA